MAGKVTLPILLLVAFFAMSAGAIVAPVLPFMVEPLNTSREAVGLVLGAYTFSTAFFMFFLSTIMDRVGRKSILIPCLLINGIVGGTCYFAPDLETLLILRFIQGVGIAGMLPIVMTMIGELYSGFDRVNAMGMMSMTTGIGGVSAPLIGGAMAVYGWNVPFLFYFLTVPLAVVAVFMLPETNLPEMRTKNGMFDLAKSLGDVRISYTMFLAFAVFFLLYTMVIYVPFTLKENYGFDARQAGLALGFQGIAMAIVASRAKNLAEKHGKQLIVRLGFIVTGIALAGTALANSLLLNMLFIFLFGIGFGMVQPSLNTLITQVAPPKMMGGVVSIYNIMKYVGQTAAPLLLALVLFNFSLPVVFVSSSVIAFIAAATLYAAKDIYAGLDGK
ncbi:MFS transporter [Methanolobus sp. ZRKC3]|uniref:MFS transporter n=1 Tax=Methanolobus sp. ZRKC3 TaxID=3125786 RepID=UPI0032531576